MQIENQEEFDEFMRRCGEVLNPRDLELPRLKDCIATLWKDPAVMAAWEERNQFHIIDSHQRFVAAA